MINIPTFKGKSPIELTKTNSKFLRVDFFYISEGYIRFGGIGGENIKGGMGFVVIINNTISLRIISARYLFTVYQKNHFSLVLYFSLNQITN